MVLTNPMKARIHSERANISKQQAEQHRRDSVPQRQQRIANLLQAKEDEVEEFNTSRYYGYNPNTARRNKIIDSTKEQFDYYSNLDVGTKLRHLHFGDSKFESASVVRPINFTHVVDLDLHDYKHIVVDRFLKEVLSSYTFRWTILALVIVNALIIGLNTYETYKEDFKMPFEIIDQIILSVFIFEIALKWMYDFRAFWLVFWNVLDFSIIALIAFSSLLPVFVHSRTAIALVRVFRALRTLRSASNLTSLIVVTRTIIKSISDMANILFVLIIFMVVMAIAGVVLFDDDIFQTKMFLNCLDAWFVLFVCVTQDGWVEVLDSFREIETYSFLVICWYLIIAVTIGAFVFANLIVAVVVANLESAIKSLKAEKAKHDNPLVYRDEFSPNLIEIIPAYDPFVSAPIPITHQRPFVNPKLKNLSKRRISVYQTMIVALEQNLLEYSLVENDYVRVLGVLLGILEQMERHEQSLEQSALKRKQALRELAAYSHITIPTDALNRADVHKNFADLKGGGTKSMTNVRYFD